MPGHKRGKDDVNVGAARPKEDHAETNKRKVYVGRIPQGTCEDDIKQAFWNFNVEKVYLRPFTAPLGFAFVLLDSAEAAAQAEQEVSGACINGSTIVVRPAAQRSEAQSSSAVAAEGTWGDPMPEGGEKSKGGISTERDIFVGNLPSNVEEEDLISLFEPFGVEKVVLKRNQNPGKKNFAFVTMADKSGTAAAVDRLKNAHVRGSKITLSLRKERSRNAPAESHVNDWSVAEDAVGSGMPLEVEIYVGSLPEGATEADVRQVFSGYNVSYVQMKSKDDKTFSFVGLCGVHNPVDVVSSVAARTVRGRKIVVRLAGNARTERKEPERKSARTLSGGSCSALGGSDSWDSPPKATSPSWGSEVHQASNSRCNGVDSYTGSLKEALDRGPPPLEPILDDPISNDLVFKNGIYSGKSNGDYFQDRQLYVDNLPHGITRDGVMNMFQKFGVSEIYLRNSFKKAFAFLTLHNEDQVQQAINEMNGMTGSDGCPIIVKKKTSKATPGKAPSINNIPPLEPVVDNNEVFVSNLPNEVGEEDMLRLFEKYGVQEVHLTTSGAQPEAHVILSSMTNAQEAADNLNGASMCGKKICVEVVAQQVSCSSPRQGLLDTPKRPVVLCVANFPYSSKEHHLRELLENVRPQEVVIMKPADSQDFTRAYVSVPSWEHAEDAVLELNNTFFFGRLIAIVPMAEGTVREIVAICEPSLAQRKGTSHGSRK